MTPHDVTLRGLGGSDGPLLIESTERRFSKLALAASSTANPLPALQKWLPDGDPDASALKLYQPVHRSFTLAMCEALCDQFGEPPLDRDKIDSMGMVIRRVAKANPAKRGKNDGQPERIRVLEAWVESEQQLRGWQPFLDPADADLDPDPARRHEKFHAGQPAMKLLLAALRPAAPPLVETVSSLFIASPDVCTASRRTILFGTVPVATSERSEASPELSAVADDGNIDALVDALYSNGQLLFLQGGDGQLMASPLAAQSFRRTSLSPDLESNDFYDPLDKYVGFLRGLQIQLDVLGDTPEAQSLRSAIGALRVYYNGDPDDAGASALDHVSAAINVLVLGINADGSVPDPHDDGSIPEQDVQLPVRWGAVSDDQAAAIRAAVKLALSARARVVLPAEGRFEDFKALYQVRAFIRVKRDDGCPPELVWSDPSPDYEIVPWFESGKLPPIPIQLPEVTLANIKKFKPNVAFKVPGTLFNFLNSNKPKDLIEGKGKPGGDFGIDWICGFNIPIITICAFIILYIFLTLLNIVFWWLPFIKICIPIPRLPPPPPRSP